MATTDEPILRVGDRNGGDSGFPGDRLEIGAIRMALRKRWSIPDALRERALVVLSAALHSDKTPEREKLYAIRALATLDEIDRRRDRDDADRTAGKERLSASITSALLDTPEGRAELMRRREAAYAAHDALELRQHDEEAIHPPDATSVAQAQSSQQQTPPQPNPPSAPAPVARDATADSGKFAARSKRKRPRTG